MTRTSLLGCHLSQQSGTVTREHCRMDSRTLLELWVSQKVSSRTSSWNHLGNVASLSRNCEQRTCLPRHNCWTHLRH
ncbi:rCG33048 [Rattus norvegicus]|uniref:RCG33048 n=1 Tax=Rattus norvegicus TaxID=10116 RepID=A6HJY1_RAT|nr:rCG33048 [Rattus norvegicus]